MKKISAFSLIDLLSAFYYADEILLKTGLSNSIVQNKVLYHAMDVDAAQHPSSVRMFGMDGDQALQKKIAMAFSTTKSIVAGDRAAIVQQFGAYIKKYYYSAQFQKDFNNAIGSEPVKYRDSAFYQSAYDSTVHYAKLVLKKAKETFTSSHANAMKNEMSKQMSASDEAMKRAMDMFDQNPQLLAQSGMTKEEFIAKMSQGKSKMKEGKKEATKQIDENMSDEKNQQHLAEAQQAYNERMADAESKKKIGFAVVPEDARKYYEAMAIYKKKKDHKNNIRQTLTVFLQETADIDFNAEIKKGSSTKRFENAAFERKSNVWKACFRAGKDATDAARKFAEDWLKELK